MPNWCETEYAFYGDRNEIEDFCSKLKNSLKMDTRTDFERRWLGNVLISFGVASEEDVLNNNVGVRYRGCFLFDDTSVYSDDIGVFIRFSTTTAWEPMNEMWDEIIAKYKTLEYAFKSEEPGVGYYAISDGQGSFFCEHYKIEIYGEGSDEEFLAEFKGTESYYAEYFDTEDELIQWLKEHFNSVNSLATFRSFAEKINSKNSDIFISLHEFEAS